jgi:hypothetical protein
MLELDFSEGRTPGPPMSLDDQKFLSKMEQGAYQGPDGHYVMPLPFREGTPSMPNNKSLAIYRLNKLRTRLERDEMYRKDYTTFMDDLIVKNYAEKVWWEDGDLTKAPQEYRMTVHLFGAGSSPGCANYGLKKIANDHEDDFGSEAANFVRNDFSVDDGLISVDTPQCAISLIKQTKGLCARGGLRLHKFVSNSKEVIAAIPLEDRSSPLENLNLGHDRLPIERALSVQWCVETDTFQL